MEELLELFKQVWGEPQSHARVRKDDVEFDVVVAIPEDYDDDESSYAIVMTLGLSLTPELGRKDMELSVQVRKNLPADSAEKFGEFFYTLYQQLKVEEALEFGMIFKGVPVPYFDGATAVILDGYNAYIDEMSDAPRGLIMEVRPLYDKEVLEFEELIRTSRQMYLWRGSETARNPAREHTIMEAAVRFYWEKFAKWCKEKGAKVAPKLERALKNGGNPQAGRQLEEKLGYAIPSDYKYTLNLIHDFAHEVPVNGKNLSAIDSIVKSATYLTDLSKKGEFDETVEKKLDRDDRLQPVWWHERWVPIGFDSAGTFVLIDMAPGPRGVVGQIIVHDKITGPRALDIPNFLIWVDDYDSDLRKDRYMVSDGHIFYEDEDL